MQELLERSSSSAVAVDLRPYQAECVDALTNAYTRFSEIKMRDDMNELHDQLIEDARSELVVLPTGTGKTIVFCAFLQRILARHPQMCFLIVAHRQELLSQAADKLRLVMPGALVGQVGAGQSEWGCQFTVASVQTIGRAEYAAKLKQFNYGVVVVDEAHHVAANYYQHVLDALPNAFVVKVTATPDRLDKSEIHHKAPVYEAYIADMVKAGYLCDLKAIAVRTNTRLDELHTAAGDYKIDELETLVDTDERNELIVQKYLEFAHNRQALCFSVTVNHAWHMYEKFVESGVKCAVVSGETPRDERAQILRDYEKGTINVVCNCGVLTEGYDAPTTSCIILARPTQSRALFVQCVGRGTRLAPSKRDCLILDITDNTTKHRLEPQSLTKALNVKIKDQETLIEAIAREEDEAAIREHRERTIRQEKRNADELIDLFQRFAWQHDTNGRYVLVVGAEKHRIALVPSPDITGYYSVWAKLAPTYEAQCWSGFAPMEWAQMVAERGARKLSSGDARAKKLVDRNAAWRAKPATIPQRRQLKRFWKQLGLKFDQWELAPISATDTEELPVTSLTSGEVADMLDELFERFDRAKQAKANKQKASA